MEEGIGPFLFRCVIVHARDLKMVQGDRPMPYREYESAIVRLDRIGWLPIFLDFSLDLSGMVC